MAAITIRNLSDETHRALKAPANEHGRSTEAEVRAVLEASVSTTDRKGLGSIVAQIAAEVGGFEFEITRDAASREPIALS